MKEDPRVWAPGAPEENARQVSEDLASGAERVLEQTSRTFFLPTSRLPDGVRQAVSSAYLCLRSIDEIEDHPTLTSSAKVELLRSIGERLALGPFHPAFGDLARRLAATPELPEVSRRLADWASLAPADIAPRVWDACATMSTRMGGWAACGWKINDPGALDRYTYDVAGAVGVLLSDLWAWFDGTVTDRRLAVEFGQGLQLVNIARNIDDDQQRGVRFLPPGWSLQDLIHLAWQRLASADRYLHMLPPGPAQRFSEIPLALAKATLQVLADGKEKLSRSAVGAILAEISGAHLTREEGYTR